jgi:hypothetical protein
MTVRIKLNLYVDIHFTKPYVYYMSHLSIISPATLSWFQNFATATILVLSRVGVCDYRRVIDWWMDMSTTHKQISEL